MLTAADIARMKADVAEVIGDNEVSIIIRRGSSTLPAQTVRIERQGQAKSVKGDTMSSEETKADIVVIGEEGLDIQKDDRFSIGGVMYKVLFRRPNEMIGVQAEAQATA